MRMILPRHRFGIFTLVTLALVTAALVQPSHAITGSRSAPSNGVAQSIVTVVAAGGGVCTGTMISPNIILTAAHCIAPGTANRVIDYSSKPPTLIAPQQVAVHPSYNAQSIAAHRATADVALLHLSAPMPGKSAALLGVPRIPFSSGSRFTVVGIGSTVAGSDSGVGTGSRGAARCHRQPGTLQVRLVDPQTQNKSAGMGACTGDSGAPAVRRSGWPQRHHRRGELVNGREQLRRLRRPHRRDTAHFV